METSLIFVKPDAVQRGLIGQIVSRFEAKGLRLVGAKLMVVPKAMAETHYAEHKGKGFYDGLIGFVTSGPVFVMAWRGVDAIAVCRKLIGATNGRKAEPGTIRGDYGMSGGFNMIHGSDGPESAARELKLWFTDAELISYDKSMEQWVYDPSDL